MPTEPLLSDDEIEEIKQVILEQRLFGWTNLEAIDICGERLDKVLKTRSKISKKTFENIKRKVAERNEVTEWMTVYAKVGYLDEYMQWIRETLYTKQKQLKLFEYLTSKPLEEQERIAFKINSTARSIREATMLHASLGLGAPMLLQMKNAIDKGYANEFLPNGKLKRNQESGENNPEDIPADEYAS